MPQEIEFLTRGEVAKIFKVSSQTVKRWERNLKLKNHAPEGSRKPLYLKSEVLSTLTPKAS